MQARNEYDHRRNVDASNYLIGHLHGVMTIEAPHPTRVLSQALTHFFRVGQKCIYTPYMTVYSIIPLPKIPYIYDSGQPYIFTVRRLCFTGKTRDS